MAYADGRWASSVGSIFEAARPIKTALELTESLKYRAALAEIDRREGYEVRLLAALMVCTQPVSRRLGFSQRTIASGR